MLSIIDASPQSDFTLHLRFSDGREGSLNFKPMFQGDLPPAFSPLLDHSFFLRFELRDETLHWPGDLDLAPEYLYFKTFEHEPALQQRFVDWGYANRNSINA
jgi:hypothetical protein